MNSLDMKSGQNVCHEGKSHWLFLWVYDLLRAHRAYIKWTSREFQGYDDDVKTLVTIHKFLHTFALSKKKSFTIFF